MSTDPHTLDAVLAHREALLAQIDALRAEREDAAHLRALLTAAEGRAALAEREVERLAGLLGRYGRGILGCAASGCEGCMVCDPEKVVERIGKELGVWRPLVEALGVDGDSELDDARLAVVAAKRLTAERDEARADLAHARGALRRLAGFVTSDPDPDLGPMETAAAMEDEIARLRRLVVAYLGTLDTVRHERDSAYARGVEDADRQAVKYLRRWENMTASWADDIEAGLHRQGGDRGE